MWVVTLRKGCQVMKALVVYESLFGNTERVAQAIVSGLATQLEVELVEVTDAPPGIDEDLDLVVVGGPTHTFSMTRESTREEAFTKGATHGTAATGLREWLGHLEKGRYSAPVATFDTRVEKMRRLPGSAAKGAAKLVHKLGYPAAAPSESFYVEDVDGPLLDGELDRARAWGERLAADVAAVSAKAPL